MINISPLVFKHLRLICFFILVFQLNNISLPAQSQKVNNWKEDLSKTKGQERIDLIVKTSKGLVGEDILNSKSLAEEGISLAKQMGDSLSMYQLIKTLGDISYQLNEIDEGINLTQQSLNYFAKDKELTFEKAKIQLDLVTLYLRKRFYHKADSLITDSESFFLKTNDLLWQSKALYSRGSLYLTQKEFKKADTYFTDAIKISKPLDDIENTAKLMMGLGVVKMHQSFYPEALELQLQVVSMKCSNLIKAKSYGYIGLVYRNLEDWNPAIKHIKKSIELKKRIGLECATTYGLYDIGIVHKRQMNFGEASKYLKKCLALQKKCQLNIGNTLISLGSIHHQLGETKVGNMYYDQQMEIVEARDDWTGKLNLIYNRGYYAYKAKNYNESLEYLSEALQTAEEKEHLHFLMKCNATLANVYDAIGKEQQSIFHAERYQFFKDSISGLKKIKKIGALEQKHLHKLQQDSLKVVIQSDQLSNQDKGISTKLKMVLGLGLFILSLFITFLFSKKYHEKKSAPTERKSLDQEKVDQYFEAMFERLAQSKKTAELEKNESTNLERIPIHDMTEFLKTNLAAPSDWASFEHYFTKVHKDFFKNLKLAYPTISTNEMNMCTLLKLNLRNKDIAQIMGISPGSVRKAQDRLSKRIALPADEVLRDFVLKM